VIADQITKRFVPLSAEFLSDAEPVLGLISKSIIPIASILPNFASSSNDPEVVGFVLSHPSA
jgi:hypothetical protein